MESQQPSLFPEDQPPWELDAAEHFLVGKIVFAEPPFGPFDYRIPDDLVGSVRPGMRVRVPLGKSNRGVTGYCIAVESIRWRGDRLKDILSLLDADPLCSSKLLELIRWMAQYYVVPLGQVFESVIPAGVRTSAGVKTRVVLLASSKTDDMQQLERLPPKQLEVMKALLAAKQPLTLEHLRKRANCSTGPIQQLRRNGWIDSREEYYVEDRPSTEPITPVTKPMLSEDQRSAFEVVEEALDSGKHQTVLLHGVTGSGKTEVYMEAIEKVIGFGRQAIVLVPEISLTPQTRARFQERFAHVSVVHSHLTDAERHYQWRLALAGAVSVVIGPRSAIFAPVPNLGLIILDEEHESSFKQETIPRYHARDVALHRAFLENIPLVLGSATPSLESWNRVRCGTYRHASLPRRIYNRPMPSVRIIDLRSRRQGEGVGIISPQLRDAIEQTIHDQGQTILLLNRRGFATTIQCPACGRVLACPNCDLPLTHHRDGGKSVCHYCDFTMMTPSMCPSCNYEGIHFYGTGTQKLEIEVRNLFPNAEIARMDSDTMKRPGSHERVLDSFRSGKLQILLGTQMIAKGLDFPNVLLVGVVHADTALHFPDFRAAERTFQLIAQVAGRAGRGDRAGQVLVQTFSPEHFAILAASRHDFEQFASAELNHRQQYGYPPFASLARIIVRGESQKATEDFAELVGRSLNRINEVAQLHCRILGPALPPIAKLRNKYRFHLFVSSTALADLIHLLTRFAGETTAPSEIQFVIDVDPVDML